MSITIIPLGGFGEVGRNCVAVDVNGDIVIVDMGIHLERYIEATEDDFTQRKHTVRKLSAVGALPDLRALRKRIKDVKAIVCSHAHLDHVGAIPFIAKKFSCPIYATPFTAEVIAGLAADKNKEVNVIRQETGKKIPITDNIFIELIHIAHSTPQSAIVAIHTKEGIVLYANDFKNDQSPPFEEPSDMKRIEQLKGKIKVLILDSLYAPYDNHSRSESNAREQVFDVVEELEDKRAVVASTFGSHIYRLITFCDTADKLNRKVVFIGRSLQRYINAAKDAGIVDISKRGRIFSYAKQARRFLETLEDPTPYFLVTTGHQGEPNAILSRMTKGLFKFTDKDAVLFSCSTIPVPLNIQRRAILESDLTELGVAVIKDVHVSGHAHGKDEFELLKLLEPEFFFPSHGDEEMLLAASKIARKAGLLKDQIILAEVGKKYTF